MVTSEVSCPSTTVTLCYWPELGSAPRAKTVSGIGASKVAYVFGNQFKLDVVNTRSSAVFRQCNGQFECKAAGTGIR